MGLSHGIFRSCAVLVTALSFPVCGLARIYPIPDIARLTSSSPVIVVGEVIRVVQVGEVEIPTPGGKPFACQNMTAFIRVDEVLNGEFATGTIQINYPYNPDWNGGPLTNALSEGRYLMYFLKPEGDEFVFAAPEQSAMTMSRSQSEPTGDPNADLYTRVLQHLARGLFDPQASSQDRIQTIFEIDHERSPIVAEIFRQALHSQFAKSDRVLRFDLLAALLRHKDLSVLPDLKSALLTVHDADASNARVNMIYALRQIDSSVADPILIQALRLPEPELRGAAASTLDGIRSEAAISALFGALDDPDTEVRRSVVNSLTSIFRESQCLPPNDTEDQFKSCVERWKAFAAAREDSPQKQAHSLTPSVQ